MVAIRVEDLKERTDEVLRRLQETGEAVENVDDDRAIARLVPADEDMEQLKDAQTLAALAELDRLGEEIAASIPLGTTLENVIRDMRRDAGARSSVDDTEMKDAVTAAIWDDLERISVEIGRRWPAGVTAAEAVRDDRHDL